MLRLKFEDLSIAHSQNAAGLSLSSGPHGPQALPILLTKPCSLGDGGTSAWTMCLEHISQVAEEPGTKCACLPVGPRFCAWPSVPWLGIRSGSYSGLARRLLGQSCLCCPGDWPRDVAGLPSSAVHGQHAEMSQS